MQHFHYALRSFFILLAALSGFNRIGEAQSMARVEKIQRTVQKQVESAPVWVTAKAGTTLADGERLRTGKRSKSDVRFTDKSLLRLGQLSSLELRGPREVRLLQGQLLFSALSPARILAGSAAAAIKGTVPLIQVLPNGDAEFTLFNGEVEITSPQGTRTLLPGQWIRVYADGRFSPTKSASPFLFMNGGRQLDLLLTPRQEPFVGSNYDFLGRDNPNRQLFDQAMSALSPEANDVSYNPLILRGAVRPTPGGTPGPTPGVTPGPTPVATATPTPLPPTGNAFTILAEDIEEEEVEVEKKAKEEPATTRATASPFRSTAAAVVGTTAESGEEHLGEVDPNLGTVNVFDTHLFGASSLGSGPGDGNLLSGRLGVSDSRGPVYVDLALTPIRLRTNSRSRETVLVTQALLLYRNEKFDFQLGRQRILDGPVQATMFGSMLRQNGRNTFDAVRFTTAAESDLKLDLVYLIDAAPRQFVADVPGRQRGWYGRLEKRDKNYALGLNVLHFGNAPTSTSTGATVDFVVPVVQNAVEAYGEIGRDPFKRRMRTFGLNFPVLYEKTGFELFVETSKLKSSGQAIAPPREIAARLYKQLGSNWNLLAGASKFQGRDTRFVVGVTVGASRTQREDLFGNLLANQQ